MRYLGNKTKLLKLIENVIDEHNIKGETFADLFSGTGVVGDYFKDKYKIISNDSLYYCYILNKAKLENNEIPQFKSFYRNYNCDIFLWLNSLPSKDKSKCFVYNNYTPKGNRKFFTEKNGIKIDSIRLEIENLKIKNQIDDNEYNFLIASLIESITKFSNISGTYEAFLKHWDKRALNDFIISPLNFKNTLKLRGSEVFQKDANILAREISGDIAYLDPPYTVTQYISAYHMFETIARYDYPEIKGIGGKRDRNGQNSFYSQRSRVLHQFEDLFRQLNFKHILLSYNNKGLVDLEELISLAKTFAKDNIVHVKTINYREYRNHRVRNKTPEELKSSEKHKEVIIYFEKDLTILKSPLNYSGSKNYLVSKIQKELPKSIDTFVDVMGGAFNVGCNIYARNEVVYNEINTQIYSLVKWLLTSDKQSLVKDIENDIKLFSLSKRGKEEYNNLRTLYNGNPNVLWLYILHLYSFQNMIRFNTNKKFNTPIGVAGYSEAMKNRILNFNPKTKKVKYSNKDYLELNWESFPAETLFYFDPPYSLTKAAYNDGKRGQKGWNNNSDGELLGTLDNINQLGYKFILSNAIEHKGETNHLLVDWIKKNDYNIVDLGKSGWRYSKKEVIIKNY
ncbi:DNA adenine methylase [Salinicoccus sp. Marseille-QA3877]